MNELEDYKAKKRQEGSDAGSSLIKAINTSSFRDEFMEGFIQEITNNHPTLQQGVMKGIYEMMMVWAERCEHIEEEDQDRSFDGRNEATLKFCKEVKKIENAYFPFI